MANNFSTSLAITPTDTINPLPAWEFMNQTGTLGSFLAGSLIYVGGTTGSSDVSVITSGTIGIQNSIVRLTQLTNGSGYYVGAAIGTTRTSIVPTSVGPKVSSGLTVSIDIGNVPVPTTSATALGTGYTGTAGAPAAFTTTGGTGTGLIGIITGVNGTGGITAFTITRGGQGYTVNNVLAFVSGDGINGTMTLSSAPNGAVTGATIVVGGEGYAIGDVITIDQTDSNKNATFRVDNVQSFPPVIGDAVVFESVPVGSVLPVYVDYVTATGTDATLLIAGRESSIS